MISRFFSAGAVINIWDSLPINDLFLLLRTSLPSSCKRYNKRPTLKAEAANRAGHKCVSAATQKRVIPLDSGQILDTPSALELNVSAQKSSKPAKSTAGSG